MEKTEVLSDDEVLKLAKLARLEIEAQKLPGLKKDLNSILGYVQKLSTIDVSKVSGTSHVNSGTNVVRPDVVQDGLSIEEMLKNAPDRSGRFIRVPIIVDHE